MTGPPVKNVLLTGVRARPDVRLVEVTEGDTGGLPAQPGACGRRAVRAP